MQNDQNFNDRSQIQEDPLQDALGKHPSVFTPSSHYFLEKHFNVSAAQAKKFMNQIKNQLHVNPPGEVTFSTFLTTFSYLFSERRYKLEIRAAWRVDSFCRKRLDFPFSRLQIESK